MSSMHRRTFLAGAAAGALVAASAPYVHAQKKGGTLKFVPHADLKILDPVWTTAYITRNHGYMIYDMLFAPDASIRMQPQMVDKYTTSADKRKWSFVLRDGLRPPGATPTRPRPAPGRAGRPGSRRRGPSNNGPPARRSPW